MLTTLGLGVLETLSCEFHTCTVMLKFSENRTSTARITGPHWSTSKGCMNCRPQSILNTNNGNQTFNVRHQIRNIKHWKLPSNVQEIRPFRSCVDTGWPILSPSTSLDIRNSLRRNADSSCSASLASVAWCFSSWGTLCSSRSHYRFMHAWTSMLQRVT